MLLKSLLLTERYVAKKLLVFAEESNKPFNSLTRLSLFIEARSALMAAVSMTTFWETALKLKKRKTMNTLEYKELKMDIIAFWLIELTRKLNVRY